MLKKLKHLKELHAKTTEGPWINRGDIYIFGVGKMVADIGYDGSVLRARGVGGGMSVDQQVSNLQFCIEAHRLVPRLIEALEKCMGQRNECIKEYTGFDSNESQDYYYVEWLRFTKELEQILEGKDGI